jgi:hypothetical protein
MDWQLAVVLLIVVLAVVSLARRAVGLGASATPGCSRCREHGGRPK